MSLLPDILAVRRSANESGHAVVLDLHLPASLAYFPDHFPDLSLLPGVVQIDWAMRLAAVHHGVQPSHFAGMRALKFTAPVTPDTTLSLELRLLPENATAGRKERRVEFAYVSAQKKYSSGQLLFTRET